jgi:opacity protein-like surface antigen
MTISLRRLTASAAALLTVSAATAHAQVAASTRPVSVGVFGGLTLPSGDFGDAYDSGYNVGGLLEFTPAVSPLAFRLEGTYQRFSLKEDVRIGAADDLRVISGVANALYKFGGAVARPYVIGGLGAYNLDLAGDDTDSETKLGFNVGAGLEIPLSGITVFGDVRYESIRTEVDPTNLFPIRVGLRF